MKAASISAGASNTLLRKVKKMTRQELKIGDTVTYKFVTRAGGLFEAIVEIVALKSNKTDGKPLVRVKFHTSIFDNTGNRLFDYLARTGGEMWASQEHLYLSGCEETNTHAETTDKNEGRN